MKKQYFITNIKVIETRDDGGKIRINTAAVDRDKDRVYPSGARLENYLENPVVLWGHNYREPWAVAGRTNSIERTDDFIDVDFDLRDPANESDPMHIIRLLWRERFVKTASIGFMPVENKSERNEVGGYDFLEWDLLEWSLIPVPSNQEALRLAVKALETSSEQRTSSESDESDKDGGDIEQTQERATQSESHEFDGNETVSISFINTESDDDAVNLGVAVDKALGDQVEQEESTVEEVETNNDMPSPDEIDAEAIEDFFKQLKNSLSGEKNHE